MQSLPAPPCAPATEQLHQNGTFQSQHPSPPSHPSCYSSHLSYTTMRWPFSKSPSSPTSSSAEAITHDPDIEPAAASDATKPSSGVRLRRHLETEVNTHHADLLLLVCCFLSGLVDSTIYNGMVVMGSKAAAGSMFDDTSSPSTRLVLELYFPFPRYPLSIFGFL
jgi:hypothetical protein